MPNPILKVLSTLDRHRAAYLLMGGQACVFYGAAEFSRDTDVAVLADAENLRRLGEALDALQAERIAVPPFSADYLLRGHAVHFRCRHPEALVAEERREREADCLYWLPLRKELEGLRRRGHLGEG